MSHRGHFLESEFQGGVGKMSLGVAIQTNMVYGVVYARKYRDDKGEQFIQKMYTLHYDSECDIRIWLLFDRDSAVCDDNG